VAKLNSLGAVFMSLLFGGLLIGGRFAQANLGVSNTIVNVLLGAILLSILLEPLIENWLLNIILKDEEDK
jgi:ABC-type uncharacterized transport system permease subunit